MSALTFEHWPVERIVEYARNPRKNDHAVDQMAAAIQEFGFRIPCVVQSDGRLVDGHLRLKAARKLGLATVPVVLADDLTPAQIKAFRILANRSATWAEWDDDLLRLELEELRLDDFDLSLTGFDENEIGAMLAPTGTEGLTDEDESPEISDVAVSMTGDLWVLGQHRLLCGDSTNAGDVDKLLGGNKPHLMVTDPPYGVNYDPDWRNRAKRKNGEKVGGRAIGIVMNDDKADWTDAYALFPGDVAYVWHAAGPLSPEITGCEAVRLIDGLGCKRREQWLISRSTSAAMLLWFIAATNAQERRARIQSALLTAAKRRGFAMFADTTESAR